MTLVSDQNALSALPARAVDGRAKPASRRYSFVSLVTDPRQYAEMVESFIAQGFTPDVAEFLYGDNTNSNRFDGYRGLNRLIEEAVGQYIICLHQDILARDDGLAELDACLAELDDLDPDWAVAANAGRRDGRYFIRITDKHGESQNRGPFPAEVDVVDENFFVLRRDRLIGPSFDLSGLHVYGLDVVMQAQSRGLKAYVIDFLIDHLGQARVDDSYVACMEALEAKVQKLWASRVVPTLVEDVVLSGKPSRLTDFSLRRVRRKRRHAARAHRATEPEHKTQSKTGA